MLLLKTVLLLLGLFFSVGCVELAMGNPQATDACSQPGSIFIVANQELTPSGWRIELANISDKTVSNAKATVATEPIVSGEEAVLGNGSLTPAQKISFKTAGNYAVGKHYATQITITYERDGFNMTTNISCSGTA